MIALAHSNPWCLAFLAWLYLVSAIFCYCEWFLYGRLICLPAPADQPADSAGDHLVIGTLINILQPEAVGDNDYSIGILLQGTSLGVSQSAAQNSMPFGYLVTNQPVTKNFPLLFTGHHDQDTDPNSCPVDQMISEDLHCEFEGAGMYDLDLAAQIAYPLAMAAVVACLIPKIGWIVALIIAGISLVILLFGLLLGLATGGDPNDVNPNVGELHTNQCDHTGADTLLVKGRWVYDSGHIFPLVESCPLPWSLGVGSLERTPPHHVLLQSELRHGRRNSAPQAMARGG